MARTKLFIYGACRLGLPERLNAASMGSMLGCLAFQNSRMGTVEAMCNQNIWL